MEIKRGRSPAMTVIVVLFVLALAVTTGTLGYFWYQKTHQTSDTSSSSGGGSISLDTAPKVETEQITSQLVIPTSTDKPGDTIKTSTFNMTVPKAWRTVNGKNVLNTPLDSVYAESASDILAQLIMVPESQPADPLLATNGFSLYNVTSWLAKPTSTQQGTVTPATKVAYVQNIANIGDGKTADKNACAKGYGALNTSMCGDLLNAQPVSTGDGTLKGVVFFNAGQSSTYDPQALVFLTGKVKDQQLLGYGAFHILDQNSHTLSASDAAGIKAASDALTQGNIPTDTLQLFQHVVDAIKSIHIQAN